MRKLVLGQAANILRDPGKVNPADSLASGLLDYWYGQCALGADFSISLESSWLCCLQKRLKLERVAALDKEGVGIVALGQQDAASSNTLDAKAIGQLLGSMLAAPVVIDIEGEIDGAQAFA